MVFVFLSVYMIRIEMLGASLWSALWQKKTSRFLCENFCSKLRLNFHDESPESKSFPKGHENSIMQSTFFVMSNPSHVSRLQPRDEKRFPIPYESCSMDCYLLCIHQYPEGCKGIFFDVPHLSIARGSFGWITAEWLSTITTLAALEIFCHKWQLSSEKFLNEWAFWFRLMNNLIHMCLSTTLKCGVYSWLVSLSAQVSTLQGGW